MKKMLKYLVPVFLVGLFMSLAGCTGDTNTSNSPNPNPYLPIGSVSGVLLDSESQAPIANADVYIMDKHATTGAQGQFTIYDVPANTAVATVELAKKVSSESSDGSYYDAYNVIIDMKNVNAKITTGAKYPAFAYSTVEVKYTDLGDANPSGETATNHATPVNGFVANIAPKVGKLEGSVWVQVVDETTLQPVDTATERLYSKGSDNSETGDNLHLIKEVTLVAGDTGIAKFEGVEVFQNFAVFATTPTEAGNLWHVGSLGKGYTVKYLAQGQRAPLTVSAIDDTPPLLISTTPANHADVAAATAFQVKFVFNEDIEGASTTPNATLYAGRLTPAQAAVNGIRKDVAVYYEGSKDDGVAIPFTLSWLDARTLAVTFNTVAASKYSVVLSGQVAPDTVVGLETPDSERTGLTDLAGNLLNADKTITFTTTGSPTLTAPVISNANNKTVIEWLPITNAVEYKIYAQAYSADGTLLGGTTITTSNTFYPLDLSFANGINYKVTVVAMTGTTGNYIEGPGSNILAITDTAPAKPVNLVRLGTSSMITWDQVSGATGYNVIVLKIVNGIAMDVSSSTRVYTAAYTMTQQFTDTTTPELSITYSIRVQAVNQFDTVGPLSDALILTDMVKPKISSVNWSPIGSVFDPTFYTAGALNASPLIVSGSNTLKAVGLGYTPTIFQTVSETKTFAVVVYFDKAMVKADVEKLVNWSISKGTATNGGLYTNALENDVLPAITSIQYVGGTLTNPSLHRAIVYFTYTDNATNDASSDPFHVVFTFANGKDANGLAIDATADSFDAALGIF